MARLILVRHGQTDWTNINRIQGEVDVPLNKEGVKQARILASQLSGEKINVIFSSRLSRSYVTAEEIARHHKLKVKRLKDLNELNQGLWQGLLLTEIEKRYEKQYKLWREDPTLVQPPKGENIKEAYDRIVSLVQKLIDKMPDKTICIVSHEIITGLIKSHFKNLNLRKLWDFTLKNATKEVIEVTRE